MAQIKILLVEDDALLAKALTEQVAAEPDMAPLDVAASVAAAMTLAKSRLYDLMIIDVGLPDGDGRDLCRILRDVHGVSCPIVILTGLDSDVDAIAGLDSGATDYLTKPARLSVLMARVRAHLRQVENSAEVVYTVGPYQFQPGTKTLVETSTGKRIRLTEKESAMMRYLLRQRGQPVSKETLLHEVWGYNASISTHTLETHVYRLRRKIEPDPDTTSILITEGAGYRLNT